MNIIKKLIEKAIERKMARIEKQLNSANPEEFQKAVNEMVEIIERANKTLERIENK